MKNRLLALVVFLLVSAAASAQTTAKIGYADVDYILSQMPDSKQVESELQTHNTQLTNQIQAKYQEYQQKLQTYQQGAANMVDAIKKEKETELAQLEQRIQKFQQDAQASMQKKTSSLMEPLYNKISDNIKLVAKEGGYTHILNGQVGGIDVVLYADEAFDVSNAVLGKMGITPSESGQ